MSTQDKVIILKKTLYGEDDLVIHALSSQGAKISFIAKSARKSKRRFGGGVLEPTHLVQVQYSLNKKYQSSLFLLEEASLLEVFSKLRTDYDRLQLALHFVEVVEKVSQEEEQHSEALFRLLGQALRAAENINNLSALKLQFALKLLWQQGVLEPEEWMWGLLKRPFAEVDQVEALDPSEISHFESITATRLKSLLS